ncbi:hypothetical protein VPNG_02639 [Cytospora leucostoma]|uniref:Uncharacterized protein n=1 Tax=Cytospora leucostoma TaxID=1230097 RepID=A0A423XIF5_9PEZI|nr:hypothetical protein VPNG_02639 [Cytospora leucostoma]
MKLINTLTAMAATATATTFTEVSLTPPLNWIAGSYLFPTEIIAGYNAPVDDYNQTAWDAHILASCESYTACTSAVAYQGTNSGSTGGRYWYGYVFRGGATNESFYVRDTETSSDVTDSVAWTIVE